MLLRLCLLFLFFLSSISNNNVHALVGVENSKPSPNLPNNVPQPTKSKVNNNKQQKKQSSTTQSNNIVKTGAKPSDVPDFPQVGVEGYKMLFDDGFSNIVEDEFQIGEEWDVFINPTAGREIYSNYIAGNDEEYTQMDALQAEKRAVIDGNTINKDNITTHRTRIMAYLTLDQMLFDDLFGVAPHGYYVTAVTKQG